MTDSRTDILSSLSESIEEREIEELKLGTVVKGVAAYAGIKALAKAFKLPQPSKFSKRITAIDYAKSLAKAKDQRETVIAAVGLLNIVSRVIMTIPELRDIGFRLQQLVNREEFEDYLEG